MAPNIVMQADQGVHDAYAEVVDLPLLPVVHEPKTRMCFSCVVDDRVCVSLWDKSFLR